MMVCLTHSSIAMDSLYSLTPAEFSLFQGKHYMSP